MLADNTHAATGTATDLNRIWLRRPGHVDRIVAAKVPTTHLSIVPMSIHRSQLRPLSWTVVHPALAGYARPSNESSRNSISPTGDRSYPHGRIGLELENSGSTGERLASPTLHSYCEALNLYAA